MAVVRERPYLNFNFLVDLGNGEADQFQSGFCEVILPDAQVEVIEYRQGNSRENNPVKVTGEERYSNLILKRGLNGSLDLYEWYNAVRNGMQNVERTVTVRLLNEDRSQVVWSWIFRRARIIKHTTSPLNAMSEDTLFETIELVFERMEIE